MIKRLIDIVGASVGLLATTPFWPLIIFLIKIESRGAGIVRIERVSAGKTFKVYKFRSMIDGAHALKNGLKHLNERGDGPFFKIQNDPRITQVGKIIRKFHVDEIPQLINVLKGEMSLVGPRPHEPNEIIHYPIEYSHLILAKAGLTGLSQVNGASSLQFLRELELDSDYIKNQSLLLDAKILMKTAKIIFTEPKGV
ncbi:MAG: sugar transferase [Patescibacteria group bacterium]